MVYQAGAGTRSRVRGSELPALGSPAPRKATGRGCETLAERGRASAGGAWRQGGMLGPGHPARAPGPDVPVGWLRTPCPPPSPLGLRDPACPAGCPPASEEGKEAALGLWVILASPGLGIWAVDADEGRVCGLCRGAHRQDPDSPCDILGKSLLPGASVFPFVRCVGWAHPMAYNVWFAAK